MVDAVVNEYLPDRVSPPGETLAEILAERGMKQSELAIRTGRTTKHINEIIKGKASITAETAIQLERVLGIPASFWNNRQSAYDEFVARAEESDRIDEQLHWASLFPYNHMAKLGWVKPARDKASRLRSLLNYFEVATPDAWECRWQAVDAAYRLSQSCKPDRYALAAWLQMGELVGRQRTCKPFDVTAFRAYLEKARGLSREPADVFQKELMDGGLACGVVVAFIRELPKTASGVTRWLHPDKALMQLSLRYKTDDQLWFTFFHEAAHIQKQQKRRIFIEGVSGDDTDEAEANLFAANFLIPPDRYELFVADRKFNNGSILQFADDLGVAPGVVVGRLQHDKYLPHNRGNHLKRHLSWRSQ